MAETARGYFEKLMLIWETDYGVTPTVNDGDMVCIPFINNSISTDENMIKSEVIRNGKRYMQQPAFGNVNVGGDVTIPAEGISLGYWLKFMFGDPVTTGVGPYLHTYTPKNDNPSASLQGGFSDKDLYFLWDGVKVNSAQFQFVTNQELQATMSLVGREETSSGTTLDNTPVENNFRKFQAKQVNFKLNGSTIATATECTLNIDQGIDTEQYTLSSNGRRVEAPEGMLDINGTAKLLFRDLTYYNLALNNTEFSIEITATNGTDTFTVTLPEVVAPLKPVERNGAGPVMYNLEFEAYWQDDASGYPITFTLENDKPDYAS
jgi:hypothetical protein